jgi:hypothetical protein
MAIIPTDTANSCVDGTLSTLRLHPVKRRVSTARERERREEKTGTRPWCVTFRLTVMDLTMMAKE